MKKKLIIVLTLLSLVIITACGGGQATQTLPVPIIPTQTVTQPAPVLATATESAIQPTLASAPTDTAVPAINAPVAIVSFAKDVMPIFVNSCNDCHGVKQIKEGLDLRTYDGLMTGSFNGTVLIAGNSADSLLVQQLINGKMPKRGPKLTAAQIKIISDWVDAGALNN